MAAGKINLQSNDGKVAGVVFEDGASSNVTVTVPKEGGVVATEAYADTKVSKTGDETIAGVKTFSSSPIVPTPTTGTQAVNKDYADLKQAKLGFTPVQQGTGIGQLGNAVKIGWSGTRTKITIDVTDMGNIVMDSNFTGANQNLSANGYQKLPGGFIIQWGTFTQNNLTDLAISFPVTFPNLVGFVTVAMNSRNGGADQFLNGIVAYNVALNGFTSQNRVDSNGNTFRWLAIGF